MNRKEQQKEAAEFAVLELYCAIRYQQRPYKYKKQERPDYIITVNRNESIGIEITELTTEVDMVCRRIANDNYKTEKSAEEVRAESIKKHGSKAKIYAFKQNDKVISIRPPAYCIDDIMIQYAEQIVNKYNKYKGIAQQFDKFCILCDARASFAITSANGAMDVIDIVKKAIVAPECSFTVAILYCNSSNNVLCVHETSFVLEN